MCVYIYIYIYIYGVLRYIQFGLDTFLIVAQRGSSLLAFRIDVIINLVYVHLSVLIILKEIVYLDKVETSYLDKVDNITYYFEPYIYIK